MVQVTASDGAGRTASQTINVTVTPVNDNDPLITSASTANVAEGTTAVLSVTATDADLPAQTLTFSISGGADAGKFSINAGTGELTFSAVPDFENPTDADANNVYVVQVTASDGAGRTASQTISVTVTNVNDAPVNTVPGTQTTDEDTPLVFSAAGGNPLSISDADAGSNPVIVTLTATHGTLTLGSTASLVFGTGDGTDDPTMTFAGTVDEINAALDGLVFTPSPQFHGAAQLQITVNDQGSVGSGGVKTDLDTIGITVNPVNDAPVVDDQSFSVLENTPNGTVVGTIAVSDADAADWHTFTLTGGTGATAFHVDPATGQITVADSSRLDYESATRLTLEVEVTDNGSPALTDTATITIDLVDENDTPPAIVPGQVFHVAEDAASGTSLGLAAAADPDTVGTLQGWTIVAGNTDGIFAVDAGTGRITVIDNTHLDFETTPAYTLTLLVSDGLNVSPPQAVTIAVDNVNEPPVNSVPGAQATPEDTPLVFSAARGNPIAISDVDAGGNLVIVTLSATHGTLTLGSTANLVFGSGDGTADASMTFVGTLAEINAALDGLAFTPAPDYHGPASIQITVDDRGNVGLGGAKVDLDAIAITVTPVNDAPVLGDRTFVVAEHSPAGTEIGTLIGSDADSGDVLSFTIGGGDGAGMFQIDSASGRITVAGGVDLHYESQGSYRVRVRLDDGAGLSDWADVTINLLNVHLPPAAAGDRYAMDQNSTLRVWAGGVLANDTSPHGDALAALLLSAPAHGGLSLAADGSFSYTPDRNFYGTDRFTYRPTDGIEDGPAATVVIEVRPLAPPPDGDEGEPDGGSDDNDHSDPAGEGSDDAGSHLPPADWTPPAQTGDPTPPIRSARSTWTEPAHSEKELLGDQTLDSPHEPMFGGELAPRTWVRFDAPSSGARFHPATDRDVPAEPTGASEERTATFNTGLLWSQLDTLQEDMQQNVRSQEFIHKLVVGTTAAGVTGLTVGYVAWLIRGGTLLASMISSLPAWVAFDPLPILDCFEDGKAARRKDEERDEEWEGILK